MMNHEADYAKPKFRSYEFKFNLIAMDTIVRLVIVASCVVAVAVMASSTETELVDIPGLPMSLYATAKFKYSSACVYLVVANCVAIVYCVITVVISALPMSINHVGYKKKFMLLPILDSIMGGVVASAAGAAGAIGYVGLKGNSHLNWGKVCNVFTYFCIHAAASVVLSLLACVCFILLVGFSTYSLYRKLT